MKQYFPRIEEILDVLFAEMPDGVFAKDRADNPDPNLNSVSSSEIRAHAQSFADLYENLRTINQDKFGSTVTPEGIDQWEKDYFRTAQNASLGFQIRKQNLLTKIRATGGINYPYIYGLIKSILDPYGLTFDILFYSGLYNGSLNGAWIFGDSALGVDTWLARRDPLIGMRLDMQPLDCRLDYAAAGITAQDLQDIQETAYTYEVRIFGTAPPEVLALLNSTLEGSEPARSTHIITNGA